MLKLRYTDSTTVLQGATTVGEGDDCINLMCRAMSFVLWQAHPKNPVILGPLYSSVDYKVNMFSGLAGFSLLSVFSCAFFSHQPPCTFPRPPPFRLRLEFHDDIPCTQILRRHVKSSRGIPRRGAPGIHPSTLHHVQFEKVGLFLSEPHLSRRPLLTLLFAAPPVPSIADTAEAPWCAWYHPDVRASRRCASVHCDIQTCRPPCHPNRTRWGARRARAGDPGNEDQEGNQSRAHDCRSKAWIETDNE